LYRIFTVNSVVRTQVCTGVMVTDVQPNVLAGKFIKITLVFQNLSGYWYTV
jgi:hypothetical protein